MKHVFLTNQLSALNQRLKAWRQQAEQPTAPPWLQGRPEAGVAVLAACEGSASWHEPANGLLHPARAPLPWRKRAAWQAGPCESRAQPGQGAPGPAWRPRAAAAPEPEPSP